MFHETAQHAERAILIGIDRGQTDWPVSESLAELERLAHTAGAEVVARVSQRLDSPNPRTFIGSGKAEEIQGLTQSLDANLVIFDDELSPSQQSNLEHILKDCKVIDRTALILDIFALHAVSREGRLQVRLAQNQYLLPRLRGMWAHLASNRMGGGVGSRFGEGESQLEVDRRMVRKRITSIQRELKALRRSRELQRKSRVASGVFKVSLAGYTNAGKSSLLNRLTDADVLVYDKLFATLDSTTRKLLLPEGREVTISDTVGFIQKLPHKLIEAFKSTLDEIRDADLILQVSDASSSYCSQQNQAVRVVLETIGADTVPVIEVYNKVDLLDEHEKEILAKSKPSIITVSALTGEGIDELLAGISRAAAHTSMVMTLLIPFTRGDMVQMAHERCAIQSESFSERGTSLVASVPQAYISRFEPFEVKDF